MHFLISRSNNGSTIVLFPFSPQWIENSCLARTCRINDALSMSNDCNNRLAVFFQLRICPLDGVKPTKKIWTKSSIHPEMVDARLVLWVVGTHRDCHKVSDRSEYIRNDLIFSQNYRFWTPFFGIRWKAPWSRLYSLRIRLNQFKIGITNFDHIQIILRHPFVPLIMRKYSRQLSRHKK